MSRTRSQTKAARDATQPSTQSISLNTAAARPSNDNNEIYYDGDESNYIEEQSVAADLAHGTSPQLDKDSGPRTPENLPSNLLIDNPQAINTEPLVRTEEISVELPATPVDEQPSDRWSDMEEDGLGPVPTFGPSVSRNLSPTLADVIARDDANNVLNCRMKKVRIQDAPSEDDESFTTSTPRIPSHEKGKGKAMTQDEDVDPQGHVSSDREIDAQMENDAAMAARLEMDDRLPSYRGIPVAGEDLRNLWLQEKTTNEALAKEVARLRAASSLTAPTVSRIRSQSKKSDSGIPPIAPVTRIATPVASASNPLAFGVPIVSKPSSLPPTSGVARAIRGDSGGPDDSPDSSESDSPDDKKVRNPFDMRTPRRPTRPKKSTPPSNSSDGSSSDESSINGFFGNAPESENSSDSDQTKTQKRRQKRKHKLKLEKMKYQQAFLKTDPPATYHGEPQASVFKKFVREYRNWIKNGHLSIRQGIENAGKYLSGPAYKYFERDVIKGHKYTSLEEFFSGLFDYIFPVTFGDNQRDLFDAASQGNTSGVTYLRYLEELADTVGDLESSDIVRAFTQRAKVSIRSQLAMMGYRAEDLTIETLEILIHRIERALDT